MIQLFLRPSLFHKYRNTKFVLNMSPAIFTILCDAGLWFRISKTTGGMYLYLADLIYWGQNKMVTILQTEVPSAWSKLQYASIGSGNGLAPNWWQAIARPSSSSHIRHQARRLKLLLVCKNVGSRSFMVRPVTKTVLGASAMPYAITCKDAYLTRHGCGWEPKRNLVT